MWTATKGASIGLMPGRRTLGPLFLMTVCPIAVIIVWYTTVHLDGSLSGLYHHFQTKGLCEGLCVMFEWPEWKDVKLLGVFMLIQIALMHLPGPIYKGPTTPTGHVPEYVDNGLLSYTITIGLFVFGAYYHVFDPSEVYDRMGKLAVAMNIFGLLFPVALYFKGAYYPSTADCGTSGNPVFDYYWGTELYPRFFGVDVKRFTNCRFGLMVWALLPLCYAAKQYELYGAVSDSMLVAVSLHLVYVTKFWVWETGYLSSMDIMHDHAGFYLCWGCMSWLPTVYTSMVMYLVKNPNELGLFWSTFILIGGILLIVANYDADRQRQDFRAANGDIVIWGERARYVTAHYTTETGEKKKSLLLASGWWGLARHFHYVPEILSSAFWTLPCLFGAGLPWFYVFYLTLLLTDRAFRDDARCEHKYGADWKKYCAMVPYKMIPHVF